MLKHSRFGLILSAVLLTMLSAKLNASVILSHTLINGTSSCDIQGCVIVAGLGTDTVRLEVDATALNPGFPSTSRFREFPLFTFTLPGPDIPETLTLDWSASFDGDSRSDGSAQGTLYDGNHVVVYTFSGQGTVSLPFNRGVPFSEVPFSILLQASASGPFVFGQFTGGTEEMRVRVRIASVPEPASILLVLSGMLAVGMWCWRRAH